MMLGRRAFVGAGGLLLAGLGTGRPIARARAADMVEIRMMSDALGAAVWFDPIGVLVQPGTTVRWVLDGNVHTATAYHPANDGHGLRIPEQAEPWDSGYLVDPGASFAVTLTVPGVYDYFCAPHEHGGMVGRIIVGTPTGPGARPFDWFAGRPEAADWLPVPEAAQAAFPPVETIMAEKVVRLG